MNGNISAERMIGEIDVMEDIQRDIAAISQRSDEARKRELVRLRRLLSEQIGRVSVEGENVLAMVDPRIMGEFRLLLSAMRSAIALHQANWPAVRLDDADQDFTRSMLAARAAKDAFTSWTRKTLSALPRHSDH